MAIKSRESLCNSVRVTDTVCMFSDIFLSITAAPKPPHQIRSHISPV